MKLLLAKSCCAILFATLITGCSNKNKSEEIEEVVEKTQDIIVGTYTGESSEGIYKLEFNAETGALATPQLIAKASNPSYIAISKDRSKIYAVAEDGEGKAMVFKWNADQTSLELINEAPTNGMHPCHISLNESNDLVVVANYSSGNAAIYAIDENGALSESPEMRQHEGKGPNTARQEGPHAHFATFYKDEFIYVVDLGIDEIALYKIGENRKAVGEKQTALKLEGGAGPRHIEFHPNKPLVYIVNELTGAVTTAKVDLNTGLMTAINTISTLPEGFEGENSSADIHMTKDGSFLYITNRGPNNIAIFKVDTDGMPTLMGHESVRGNWPRNFTLSPDEKFLLVANQLSNNIVVFNRDASTGVLTFSGHELEMSMPVCLKF
ncbi:lactonase family protein [Urechidicola sp. KH5]